MEHWRTCSCTMARWCFSARRATATGWWNLTETISPATILSLYWMITLETPGGYMLPTQATTTSMPAATERSMSSLTRMATQGNITMRLTTVTLTIAWLQLTAMVIFTRPIYIFNHQPPRTTTGLLRKMAKRFIRWVVSKWNLFTLTLT